MMVLHEEHITDDSARRCRCTKCLVWWCNNIPGYHCCKICGELLMKQYLVDNICPDCIYERK